MVKRVQTHVLKSSSNELKLFAKIMHEIMPSSMLIGDPLDSVFLGVAVSDKQVDGT